MIKPKVLVLGANGMLGGSIHRYLTNTDKYDVTGTVRSVKSQENVFKLGFTNVESNIDALDDNSLEFIFDKIRPDFVINCIGIIKQLKESKDPITSIQVNSLLPHKLALMATTYNAKLIHFSTDCVFSGGKGQYSESDTPDEADIYGRSKLLGEIDYGSHLTLRTSIIGHEICGNVSLVDWFLSQKGKVRGFSNAIFSGLPTVVIAEVLDKIFTEYQAISGLYHLSSQPISKYDLLQKIKSEYEFDIEIDEDFSVDVDKSLSSELLRAEITELAIDDWDELLKKMHNEFDSYFCKKR